jgi:hypothetical protein
MSPACHIAEEQQAMVSALESRSSEEPGGTSMSATCHVTEGQQQFGRFN